MQPALRRQAGPDCMHLRRIQNHKHSPPSARMIGVLQQQRLREDPLMDTGGLRLAMAAMFLDAWNFIQQHERELSMPIWVAFDEDDKVRRLGFRDQGSGVQGLGFGGCSPASPPHSCRASRGVGCETLIAGQPEAVVSI